ncbi:hypothetical protein DPMN_113807 [Dreissena polymorpha]|uniref:Uncharacterized protein n=1 Tax=Dreissena polymorpha TaxID=45954 RepID=A0A9D4QR57_DREPO|nr:hypothetical protein DPMN_113807 [Dreissena polymorpha]
MGKSKAEIQSAYRQRLKEKTMRNILGMNESECAGTMYLLLNYHKETRKGETSRI